MTLWVYCALILAASFAGGYLPLVVRLTHTRMQLAISFIAGAMLGVGILHLLPHAVFELEGPTGGDHAAIDEAALWLLGGFLVMFFIERCFHFHQHEPPVLDVAEAAHEHHHEPGETCAHDHGHQHDHGHHHHGHGAPVSRYGWIGALVGLMLHSMIDGLVLAAAVTAEQHGGASPALAGLGTFLVVFLHKPFDSMTISTLMAAGGWSNRWRLAINCIYPLAIPVGMLLFLGGEEMFSDVYLGRALAFAAGCFLCIATSDLLPELQFHSHDRVKLSLALLLGLSLAFGVGKLEGDAHHRLHQHGEKSDAHDHSHAH
jgi:zinc and cadmium transporter